MHLIFVLFSLVAARYSVSVSSFAINICSEPMNAAAESFVETLERLAAQHKAGSIDDSEFEQRKLQVLSAFDLPKTYIRAPKAVVARGVNMPSKRVSLLLSTSAGLVIIILVSQATESKNKSDNSEYSSSNENKESVESTSTMNNSDESILDCYDEALLHATFSCVGEVVDIENSRGVVSVPSGARDVVREALKKTQKKMLKKCRSTVSAENYSFSITQTVAGRTDNFFNIYRPMEISGSFDQDFIKGACLAYTTREWGDRAGLYSQPSLADK